MLEVARIEQFVPGRQCWVGRPPKSRKALARAFLAKGTLGTASTKDFHELLLVDIRLRQLCGFSGRVPSLATFSRAFAWFADSGIADKAHALMTKVHLSEQTLMHVSRDATDIRAPQKNQAEPKIKVPKKKPGPKKGVPPKPKTLTRQQRQVGQAWQEAVAELPIICDTGGKKDSKGKMHWWTGFKLHVDVGDGGLPVAALTTSASVHDSQVAIPLMKISSERVGTVFYQLMDAGYVGESIPEAAKALGQVPIIKGKAYKSQLPVPFDPATKTRFANRSSVERFFSDLKMNHGGLTVRVKGHAKVHFHLMMGILSIFALALLRL